MGMFKDNISEIEKLKLRLRIERKKRREVEFLERQLCELLKQQEKELEELKNENNSLKQGYKDELDRLTSENKDLKTELFVCAASKDKLNEVHKDLNRIHITAETKAQDLVDDAKGKVMEIFFVVDKINSYLDDLKKDMGILEKDLSIGTATITDRIEAFYGDIDRYKNKLNEMKIKFYNENHVPINL